MHDIAGPVGSGKTDFLIKLIDECKNNFLLINPVKEEKNKLENNSFFYSITEILLIVLMNLLLCKIIVSMNNHQNSNGEYGKLIFIRGVERLNSDQIKRLHKQGKFGHNIWKIKHFTDLYLESIFNVLQSMKQ